MFFRAKKENIKLILLTKIKQLTQMFINISFKNLSNQPDFWFHAILTKYGSYAPFYKTYRVSDRLGYFCVWLFKENRADNNSVDFLMFIKQGFHSNLLCTD